MRSIIRPDKKGFTLIELLVVIAIIGLLSSIVLASLNTARLKGLDAQRISNLRNIQQALELYASDNNGKYPNVTNGNWMSTCSAWTVTTANGGIPNLVPNYIGSLPEDPQENKTANTCCYLYYSNGTDYKYMFYACPTSVACGTNEITGLADPARPSGGNYPACAIYTSGGSAW